MRCIKEKRLVESILERQLNSLQHGKASRTTTTFNALHGWRQGAAQALEQKIQFWIQRKSRRYLVMIPDLQA